MALRVGLPCWLYRKRLKLPSFYHVITCALLWCKTLVSSPSTSWFPELWAKWASLLNGLLHLGFFVTITENRLRQRVIWHRYTLQRNQKNFVTYFVSMFALNPNVIIVAFKSTQQFLLLKCVWGGAKKLHILFFIGSFPPFSYYLTECSQQESHKFKTDRGRKMNFVHQFQLDHMPIQELSKMFYVWQTGKQGPATCSHELSLGKE